MFRLFSQASRLFVVRVALFRRNGLSTVGSAILSRVIPYPLDIISLIRIRYVLKIKDTDEVVFVVAFSLLHKDDVETEEAEQKRGADDKLVTSKETQGARHEGEKDFEPEADDLD